MSETMDRQGFIGGSDAPVVLGLSPKSRYRLWQEKTGEVEPDDLSNNERVRWGIVLEDVVAQEVTHRYGLKLRRVNKRRFTSAYGFPMVAQIDRIIQGTDRILEIKTTDARHANDWGEEGSAEIPTPYYAQVQHQMMVTGRSVAEVAALIGGNQLRMYVVPHSPKFCAEMIDAESQFWGLVQERRAPTPITEEEAALRWHLAPEYDVQASDSVAEIVRQLVACKAEFDEVAERKERLEVALKNFIADNGNQLVYAGLLLASWKAQTRKGIDAARLRAELPEIAAQYESESTYRVLRLLRGAKTLAGVK